MWCNILYIPVSQEDTMGFHRGDLEDMALMLLHSQEAVTKMTQAPFKSITGSLGAMQRDGRIKLLGRYPS